ncbi:MAG: tryptophan--tRNA ligase [Acidobacteriota bacterium]
MKKKRVLSGFRPTGPLHVGHLVGALRNWIEMQDNFDCYFAICDWHALTSEYANSSRIADHVHSMAVDWLASGLDPERCTMFVQSGVKEHSELHLLLSMVVPLGWLERVPTYKELRQEVANRDLGTYGFLGYPVLQTADILAYKADFVPVGQDQLSHLELSREIVRKFHHLFGPLFPEPQAKITRIPRLPGIDGRKMSKSFDNAIYLSDPPEKARKKVFQMLTDPQRKTRKDPGDPDVCPVFSIHKAFSPVGVQETVNRECRRAGIGCRDCKGMLFEHLQEVLAPHQEKRREIEARRGYVEEMLQVGEDKARSVASATLAEVREAMGMGR